MDQCRTNDFIIRKGNNNCRPTPANCKPRNNRRSDLDGYYLEKHLRQQNACFRSGTPSSFDTDSNSNSTSFDGDLMESNKIDRSLQKQKQKQTTATTTIQLLLTSQLQLHYLDYHLLLLLFI